MTPEVRAAEVIDGTVETPGGGRLPVLLYRVTGGDPAYVLNLTREAMRERIAAAIRAAVAEEREACAEIAEQWPVEWVHPSAGEHYIAGNPIREITAEIRDPGRWRCPKCPHYNSGPICTKCGHVRGHRPVLALSAGDEVIHLSNAPFALCGADEPNQRTTTIREQVTCPCCLGRHRWRPHQAAGDPAAGPPEAVVACTECGRDYIEG